MHDVKRFADHKTDWVSYAVYILLYVEVIVVIIIN